MHKIPKRIHYSWLSEEQPSPLYKACRDTWDVYLSDYEFILWDISNYPKNAYTDFHIRNKHWAFVADYIRLYVVFTYGGIYLDYDFEVIKSFDDLLDDDGFIAYEDKDRLVNSICGGIKGNIFFKDCMDYMMNNFQNNIFEIAPIVTTNVYTSNTYSLKTYGTEYFYPYNEYSIFEEKTILLQSLITDKTHAIHHWAKKGWNDEQVKMSNSSDDVHPSSLTSSERNVNSFRHFILRCVKYIFSKTGILFLLRKLCKKL